MTRQSTQGRRKRKEYRPRRRQENLCEGGRPSGLRGGIWLQLKQRDFCGTPRKALGRLAHAALPDRVSIKAGSDLRRGSLDTSIRHTASTTFAPPRCEACFGTRPVSKDRPAEPLLQRDSAKRSLDLTMTLTLGQAYCVGMCRHAPDPGKRYHSRRGRRQSLLWGFLLSRSGSQRWPSRRGQRESSWS